MSLGDFVLFLTFAAVAFGIYIWAVEKMWKDE